MGMGASGAGGGSARQGAVQVVLHVVQPHLGWGADEGRGPLHPPGCALHISYRRDFVQVNERRGLHHGPRGEGYGREAHGRQDLRRVNEAVAPAARMADDWAADHGEESGGRGADPPMTDEGRVGGVCAEDELTMLRERIRVLEAGRRPNRSKSTLRQCSRLRVDMMWLRTEGTSGPSGVVVPHDRGMLQTRLDSWASGGLQQQYERWWARALFRAGVPFSFMRLEIMQELHGFMVSLMRVTIGPALVLPSYNDMRTWLLDEIYHEIAERVALKKVKWKLTGCTRMTDGATTRSYKPVVNFIAAGEDGPVLITTIDMSERDKTGVALVDLWEEVIQDIGIDVVNAYCTDNAYANKVAAQRLQDHPDNAISRIPWLPCAAHCLSLLLRDITCFQWVRPILKNTHKVVMFFKNIQKALTYHRSFKGRGQLELIRPCDTRFGSAYQMVERLTDQERILRAVVGSVKWRSTPWKGKAAQDERPVRQLVLSELFWESAHRIHEAGLLRVQSGPWRGFVDVWEDMVEDPQELQVGAASEAVYDDGMTIPEEVEAKMRSRHKEGGDRASARLLQGRDYEDEDAEDVIYEPDDVWEGKDMIEEIAAARKGKEVVRDDPLVSRVWDRPDEGSAGVQQDYRVDTGFRATTFDGEAGSSEDNTMVGLTRTAEVVVAPPATPSFGMLFVVGAGAEHCGAPIPGPVAQQPCLAVEEQRSAPVTEERDTHATVLEQPHPVVEDQVTAPTAEELEAATVISEEQTRFDGRARETEGVPTSLSSPTRHVPSACTETNDTTLAPFHSEVPLTIEEVVAGHHIGHPCVMETATHTTITQQEGAVTDESRGGCSHIARGPSYI
ncbi:hypothetical protein CBR_g8637 [Chara braunii]|uniref:DUF659 domain-containing protein n=1 Tax=Chara braunii TaxID=69332 RepID=A0A388JS35_CHABU|nr:hypothetical protein CBR_g8637 [Chara braunii]|eukprot:GBG60616.1 hypothetical protein CBR_g8637 [Chara braunii]